MVDAQSAQEQLNLLSEVSQLLTTLDLHTVMQQVIDLTSSAMGASKASLFLYGEGTVDWDHVFLTRNLDRAESIVVLNTVLKEGLAGWVVRHKEPALVRDTKLDPRWHFFTEEPNPTRSALCVPFMYQDHVLAILTLIHPKPNRFDEHDLNLLMIVANQAAVAIRTAQLFNQTQAQQQQLEMILRALPEMLIVVDEKHNIVRVNDKAQNMLGTDDTDLIGKSIVQFKDDDSAGNILAPACKIIMNPPPENEPWAYEVRDDEHGKDYQVVVSTWDNPAQHTQGFIILMHDVTGLRDLHRFKDEMLRLVSHDLRSPVSLIITAHEMIETDLPPLPEDSHIPQFMRIIAQSTERMEKLIADLLTADTSAQQEIDPAEIIQHVVDQMRPLAERKQQTLETVFDLAPNVRLFSDPLLISEAVENYISNAIKYTGRGGHITVRAYVEGDRLHYIVEDTGTGIDKEHLPRLFEPYYRPSDTVEQGYGIGLNLVKTIIEREQGRVWVESEKNVGSRFGFWLPLRMNHDR